MSTVTLEYECDGGQQPTANFSSKVSAVALDEGEYALLGLTLFSDVTAEIANTNSVSRTVVLTIQATSPLQTEDEAKDATRNLFTNKLALRVPARVTAVEPVYTP